MEDLLKQVLRELQDFKEDVTTRLDRLETGHNELVATVQRIDEHVQRIDENVQRIEKKLEATFDQAAASAEVITEHNASFLEFQAHVSKRLDVHTFKIARIEEEIA
ncbi:hypothetical protein [Paenibacillus sp. MBLB4367]|uniref:hypothetical protein n=1 Tax=Paenibacillus sp. MBLB4367 TaxID=3384767 RepID=UPI0039080ACB